MGIAKKLEDLRKMSDAQLIAEHDRLAESTVIGTAYYVDELNRRSRERAANEAHELARRAYWMAVANSILAAIAVIAAVFAIVLG